MSDDLPLFDGITYDPELDGMRLGTQLYRVAKLMGDGKWRTLRAIQDAVGGSEASVSARLRDLRKERFGAHTVERRRKHDPSSGCWEYRLVAKRSL
jgi:hypothetical protein